MLGYNPIQIYGHMLRSHYILPHIYTQEQNLRCSRWVVILISCVKPTHFTQYSTLAVLDSLCGQIDLHNETFWKNTIKGSRNIQCSQQKWDKIFRHDWFWDICQKNLFLNFVKLFSFAVCKFKLEARGGSLLEFSAVVVITLLEYMVYFLSNCSILCSGLAMC